MLNKTLFVIYFLILFIVNAPSSIATSEENSNTQNSESIDTTQVEAIAIRSNSDFVALSIEFNWVGDGTSKSEGIRFNFEFYTVNSQSI